MATSYAYDVDLDPVGTVGDRIDQAITEIPDADKATCAQGDRDQVVAMATAGAARLDQPGKGQPGKRTVSVAGAADNGYVKLAVALRIA